MLWQVLSVKHIPIQSATNWSRDRRVENVGHDRVSVGDDASSLTEVSEDQHRVDEEAESEADGELVELAEAIQKGEVDIDLFDTGRCHDRLLGKHGFASGYTQEDTGQVVVLLRSHEDCTGLNMVNTMHRGLEPAPK